jgi:hypothetical protein
MSREDPPQWLANFQESFTSMLRTPLGVKDQQSIATIDAYDSHLVGRILDREGLPKSEGLAVYQRQYWIRYFSSFQTLYPLLAHAMGY